MDLEPTPVEESAETAMSGVLEDSSSCRALPEPADAEEPNDIPYKVYEPKEAALWLRLMGVTPAFVFGSARSRGDPSKPASSG